MPGFPEASCSQQELDIQDLYLKINCRISSLAGTLASITLRSHISDSFTCKSQITESPTRFISICWRQWLTAPALGWRGSWFSQESDSQSDLHSPRRTFVSIWFWDTFNFNRNQNTLFIAKAVCDSERCFRHSPLVNILLIYRQTSLMNAGSYQLHYRNWLNWFLLPFRRPSWIQPKVKADSSH